MPMIFDQIDRDTYKLVKRMDRKQMTDFLQRIYQRGYKEGTELITGFGKKNATATNEKDADKAD